MDLPVHAALYTNRKKLPKNRALQLAQKLIPGQPLVYGQSITDGCIDWAETHALLAELAAAVRARRSQ